LGDDADSFRDDDNRTEALYLRTEANQMDDEEDPNSLQLMGASKLSLLVRRGFGSSAQVAYSAEVPLGKLVLKAHQPVRVVVALKEASASRASAAASRSLHSEQSEALILPPGGKDVSQPGNFDARPDGSSPRFCKGAEMHLVLLWTDADITSLERTLGFDDP